MGRWGKQGTVCIFGGYQREQPHPGKKRKERKRQFGPLLMIKCEHRHPPNGGGGKLGLGSSLVSKRMKMDTIKAGVIVKGRGTWRQLQLSMFD